VLSIISTVGTTVFGRYDSPLAVAVRDLEASKPSDADIVRILNSNTFPGYEIYRQALADLKAKSVEFLRRASAEVNAIEGIQNQHNVPLGNEYYFLASHTASGALAARVLADFCNEHYQASRSEARLIQRLQVTDARGFRLIGLPYLIQTVYGLLEDARQKRLIAVLNPTGGFKAAIPYLTLVGMLRQSQGVEVSCIHETSHELITLAGLPVALDLANIKKIEPLLRACEDAQETGIERDKLANGLGLSRNQLIEEHPLWSLFEQFDSDHYILSGLGSIALAELRARAKDQEVWLSRQAVERLEKDFKPGSEARQNFETILNRIGSPENRVDPYRHTYKGSNFPAYKYKGNERLFYYEHEDGYILILELAQHISDLDWRYDRVPTQLTDYAPYRRWQRTDL